MLQKTLFTILIVLSLQSCYFNSSGIKTNDSIDQDKRAGIKSLNDKLYKAIINKDVAGVRALMSDTLLKVSGTILENIVTQAGDIIKSKEYNVFNEYHILNNAKGARTVLRNESSGDNNYTMRFYALNKETYVSLLLPAKTDNEILITVIYGNYDNQWKINVMQIGQFSYFKKTAPYYYKSAKESYARSHLIDAANHIITAKSLLNPAKDYLEYDKYKEINDFHDKVMREVNARYKLPLTLTNVDTRPRIFAISPELTDEGIFPLVSYQSELNLKDTRALKLENEKVKMEVKKLFVGIGEGKKYVLYSACNEIPDGVKSVEKFSFVDEQTK